METKLEEIISGYEQAEAKKQLWESYWDECYQYAFPQRENTSQLKKGANLFDGTAPDAVEQLASSMLSELTPPWAKWFGLKGGVDLEAEQKEKVAKILEQTTDTMLQNFEHSNFAQEVHQCYLDLITVGTACLMFEEAKPGQSSAYSFCAIPLKEVALEESAGGKLDIVYRSSMLGLDGIRRRFPEAEIPAEYLVRFEVDNNYKLKIIENVRPQNCGYQYIAFAMEENAGLENAFVLKDGNFSTSPFICFRWLKAPGEVYGRSPVMKALPDIKTANKVVELILKNASIAVTGIWQADDDGILNPANIKLVPGAIIPKAVGSKGLTPLEAPGKFDVSQIVLENLQTRINHALLADRLAQISTPNMTATEVLERSAEMVRILGATFGRLQSELLTPLLKRAFHILRRRGEVMNFDLDGKIVDLQYKSPLALVQNRQDVKNVTDWISTITTLGLNGEQAVNGFATAVWLGKTLNVPESLILQSKPEVTNDHGAI